jgi:hypothetical protein
LSSRSAPPCPQSISRKRKIITFSTVVSRETSRARLSGNQTSLSNITTNFGRISIVYQELESVSSTIGKRKGIHVPCDFDTIRFGIWDLTNCRGVDKTNWRSIGSGSKVPSVVSKIVGCRVIGGFRSYSEDPVSRGIGLTSDSLNRSLP